MTNNYPYTSARIKTAEKFDIKYGRIEARVRMPKGKGSWAAFWMLPTNSPYGGWAAGGEIDIFEAINLGVDGRNSVSGTLHYGMAWPLNVYQTAEYAASDFSFSDDFQTIAIEWEEGEIRWYINDVHYQTQMARSWWTYYYQDINNGFVEDLNGPFNTPFHLILNLAVGGNLPGAPDDTSTFPMTMEVDYVRVYQCSKDPQTGAGCASHRNRNLSPPAAAAPFIASYNLYQDGIQPLQWETNDQTIERGLSFNSFWTNDGALTLSEVSVSGRGSVIDVMTTNSGNFSIYATEGGTFELFGMGNAAEFWAPHAGELIFDLFIDSQATDPESSILIKMDSGWPNLGFVELPVSELQLDQWQTLHIKISDILANPNNGGANPLDINNVVSLFVVEPTGAAHLQVDNIQIKCAVPSANGCGIKPPSQAIDASQVEVYVDQVGELWSNGMGAWDSGVNTDYFVGDNPNTKVHWQEVDVEGRGKVIEVSFDDNAATNGVFYIQSGQPIDLSGFDGGVLTFDIRVLDYGNNTSGMAFKVDCVYPCTSGDQALGVVGNGDWESITVNIADLRNAGLDTKKVNTGLVIFPVSGDQSGVTFQVDNIIWYAEGGEEVSGNPKPRGDQDLLIYNGTDTGEFDIAPVLNGISMTELVDDVDNTKGNVLEFTFNQNQTTLPFMVQPTGSLLDMSDFAQGTIEFDLLLVSEPNVGIENTDFYVKFDSVYPKTTSAFPIEKPELGIWKSYSISVADLLANPVPDWEQPVNIEAVDAVFVVAPNWDTENGTVIRLDNIRWVH
jgi:beta-glucanase (GH16 family)